MWRQTCSLEAGILGLHREELLAKKHVLDLPPAGLARGDFLRIFGGGLPRRLAGFTSPGRASPAPPPEAGRAAPAAVGDPRPLGTPAPANEPALDLLRSDRGFDLPAAGARAAAADGSDSSSPRERRASLREARRSVELELAEARRELEELLVHVLQTHEGEGETSAQ